MDNKYAGMTVNERLFISGLYDQFFEAVKRKDRDEAIKILMAVELTMENIYPILKQFNIL